MQHLFHSVRRGVAVGAALALLASPAAAAAARPAGTQGSPGADVSLPVPAQDVTERDDDLSAVDREVVVIVRGPRGPEVSKYRAGTRADARALAEQLNRRPGITAELNRVVEVPASPAPTGGSGAKGEARLTLLSTATHTVMSVPPLAAEQYGAELWGLRAVGAESAWRVTRGAGVVVAVVDSGVDATHPDLVDRVLAPIDLVGDGATGDPAGHGTHVAGIIGASLDGVGVAGLANRVSLLPVRVMDATGAGDSATVAAGIVQAADAGAQVINLSLGGPYSSVIAAAVQHALDGGATVVAAVGNSFLEGNPVTYPAALSGVLGVSSLAADGASSWFSNCGGYVDLAAPGEGILSTVPGGWAFSDGTSMASPFVAAAAGLVRAANPTFTKVQVDSALLSTSVDDSSGDGRDDCFGQGLVRADRAAFSAAAAPGGLRIPVRVSVAKAGYGNVLAVNVDPNRGAEAYTFRVQQRASDGTWTTLPDRYTTAGARETASITLGAGVFRVHVPAAGGYAAAHSAEVRLTAPTVRVTASANRYRTKLKVNVDPDQGSGYWTFRVKKRTASGSWKTLPTRYRTEGPREKRTLDLRRGKYRVKVLAKYGYQGATSSTVRLRR